MQKSEPVGAANKMKGTLLVSQVQERILAPDSSLLKNPLRDFIARFRNPVPHGYFRRVNRHGMRPEMVLLGYG